MTDEQLKPCPFCGCTTSPELKGNGIGDNWLECVECGASTRLREDGAGSTKDWNRRALLASKDAVTPSKESVTKKGDKREMNGRVWICTDPDIDRWVSCGPAHLDNEASVPAVPEGWKLVPATLTGGMVDAYRTYWAHTQNIYGAWSAMLAASPTAPAQSCGEQANALQVESVVQYQSKLRNPILPECDVWLNISEDGAKRIRESHSDVYMVRELFERAALPRDAAEEADEAVTDAFAGLVAFHAEQLDSNPYCYFELAYTRSTAWMAWITDRPAQGEPGTAAYAKSRKVIVRGQGDTPTEACQDALNALNAARAKDSK